MKKSIIKWPVLYVSSWRFAEEADEYQTNYEWGPGVDLPARGCNESLEWVKPPEQFQ